MPGMTRLLPAGAGHPDFDPPEPRAVPVHAGRDPTPARWRAGRRRWPSALRDHTLRDVSPRRRTVACACSSTSIARRPRRLGSDAGHHRHALRRLWATADLHDLWTGGQYRVMLEVAPQYQRDPSALQKIYLPANIPSQPLQHRARRISSRSRASCQADRHAGAALGASPPSSMAPRASPATVSDQFPAATISFNLAYGTSLGKAVTAIERAARDIGLPESILTDLPAPPPSSVARSPASRG